MKYLSCIHYRVKKKSVKYSSYATMVALCIDVIGMRELLVMVNFFKDIFRICVGEEVKKSPFWYNQS